MNTRIAFVHDWLTVPAGAERVLDAMLELYPGAPVYTLVYDQAQFAHTRIAEHPVHTSFLRRVPRSTHHYRKLLPLMPLAIEQFDLSTYDVVVSSSHAVAKGVLTHVDQAHISYVHTPVRYAWDLSHAYLKDSGLDRGARGGLARMILHYLRLWDASSSSRVDTYVANSRYVAQRIRRLYGRESDVIYPPVSVECFQPSLKRAPFYLTVARFVPYKRLDLIVEAFGRMGLPLVVIGNGPEYEAVRRRAAHNVRFLGHQSDAIVRDYMQRCRAFVYAAVEDFGIAMVEAQAAGAPVIALGRGGALETVIPGKTGLLFDDQCVDSVTDAVRRFERSAGRWDPAAIRANALRFSRERFQHEMASVIDRALGVPAGASPPFSLAAGA